MNPTNLYIYDQLRAEATALITATGLVDASAVTLTTPKPNILADLAFPVFPLAGKAGMNPNEFAKKVAEAITLPSDTLIGKVEPQGGFVNFAISPDAFAAAVIAEVLTRGDTFGNDTVGVGQKVILEYSSPNIARKMHVGHLRTTVIGHSLHKILLALGYEVIADNHLGDWGTQFGTLLGALDLWKREPWNEADPVQSLMYIYAQYNNAAALEDLLQQLTKPEEEDKSPSAKHWRTGNDLVRSLKETTTISLTDLARAWFKKLEDGDAWARETWQRLIDITMAEFDKTYARLDVQFDTVHGESYYEPMLGPLVQEALDKGVAQLEESGAVSVSFDDKMPSCLLRKSDGATLYQTRDAATCIYRWDNYKPTRNIYVVGAEQKLHFQQVYEIVRRMGYTEIADRSVHISFGQVTGASGERFSMRKGEVIFLDEILDAAIERATANIKENIAIGKTELTEDEVGSAAEMIGIGAVIYADLYQGPDRNIRFDFEKIVQPEGNTGVYLQYAHARCCSILRQAGDAEAEIASANLALLTDPLEQTVLKQLHRLPHIVREAGEKFLPTTIAEWTFNLAKELARFYEDCPVLKAPTAELRAARLALVKATAQGLKNGLALLAIGAPNRI